MAKYLRRYVNYPYDRDLCSKWAEVTHEAENRGQPIECADAWIAATALVLDVALATHNAGDFQGVPGLKLISVKAPK